MKTFETTLIICMIIFWLISIGISFYISKMNMQPIMHSWRKQQEFVDCQAFHAPGFIQGLSDWLGFL
jgi:hypothetical protein